MTAIPDDLRRLIGIETDRAGLGLTDAQLAHDIVADSWYTVLAREAYTLGRDHGSHELPTVTLPWTDGVCRAEVDEEDGTVVFDLHGEIDNGTALTADEATEAAAALLEGARISRAITGERPTITLHAPALSAEPRRTWCWEVHITDRFGNWTLHRRCDLAGGNPDGLARLVADQHLETRPAELANTPWRVLVWPARTTACLPETAVARVTSAGMTLAAVLGDGGLASILQPGANLVRRELVQEMRTSDATQTRVASTCCPRHDDTECPVDAPESCCDDCPALGGPLIPAMRLDELEQICTAARQQAETAGA